MVTKEDGVFRKAYRDDAIIAICRPKKQKKDRKATETQPRTDHIWRRLYGEPSYCILDGEGCETSILNKIISGLMLIWRS